MIQNQTHNKGSILLLVIFLVMSYFAFYYHNKTKQLENSKYLVTQSINMDGDSSKTIKSDGISSIQFNTLYAEKENIKKLLNNKMEQIKKLDIRINELESSVTQDINTTDTIRTICYIDSLQSICASYKDSFINISATVYRDKKAVIAYKSNESFDLYNYKGYRHKFLFFKWGKIDRFILVPKNPKTRGSIRAIKIIKKEGN